MKNLMKPLLVAVVFAMATASFAQTKKGNIVLSGGTGLQFTSSDVKYSYGGVTSSENKSSSLSFTPSFAYFIVDNLAIGITGTIATTTNKQDGGDKYTSNSSMILPTVLYYFPVEGKIRPMVQVAAGLLSQTTKYNVQSGITGKSSGSGLALNLGGGIAYFIKENISINLGLSYTSASLKDSHNNNSSSKIKQGNFGSDIGLSIYF